jgi:hypothetical protein
MAATVDRLYAGNFDSSNNLSAQELLISRLDLSHQLSEWRQHCTELGDLNPVEKLLTLDTSLTDHARCQVHLSISYYRVQLMVNGPVLTTILRSASGDKIFDAKIVRQLDESLPSIKDDFAAAKALHVIVRSLCLQEESFFDRSLAWWTCNYSSERAPFSEIRRARDYAQ